MAKPGTATKDDFIAETLARQVDDHTKDMGLITKRLEELENKFATTEKIGDTLCTAISRDTKIQEKLEEIFSKIISSNKGVKKAITDVVVEADRDWLSAYGRRVGQAVWSLVMIAVGVAITVIVEKAFHSDLPIEPPVHEHMNSETANPHGAASIPSTAETPER